MDFYSAPAVSKELKAQCFVLLAFFYSVLVDVCVRRASYFKEQNAVMGALGRRPGCKGAGRNRGRDVRKENYVRARGGVRKCPSRDSGLAGGSVGSVAVAFCILK